MSKLFDINGGELVDHQVLYFVSSHPRTLEELGPLVFRPLAKVYVFVASLFTVLLSFLLLTLLVTTNSVVSYEPFVVLAALISAITYRLYVVQFATWTEYVESLNNYVYYNSLMGIDLDSL